MPKKKGRKTKFEELHNLNCTIVIFESPKRIKKTLKDINIFFGDRIISICKEITKIYEKVYLADTKSMINIFEEINPKGEHVILIAKKGYKIK